MSYRTPDGKYRKPKQLDKMPTINDKNLELWIEKTAKQAGK